MKILRLLIVLLSLAGVVDSWLALRVHYSTGTEPCDINARWDCGVVNHSSYAEIQHVPVAVLGIAGYLLLAALAWLRRERLLTLAAIPGLGIALYLTHIEKDVLMVYCLYCVISQVLIVLILLMALAWAIWNGKNRQSSLA
ncbi:MAG: vitamin K epoxide reductase family protein [Terracidiphilus sp.]|nr:vitamin K epoxide reductase family protein [Terracidiphilus sp.]